MHRVSAFAQYMTRTIRGAACIDIGASTITKQQLHLPCHHTHLANQSAQSALESSAGWFCNHTRNSPQDTPNPHPEAHGNRSQHRIQAVPRMQATRIFQTIWTLRGHLHFPRSTPCLPYESSTCRQAAHSAAITRNPNWPCQPPCAAIIPRLRHRMSTQRSN